MPSGLPPGRIVASVVTVALLAAGCASGPAADPTPTPVGPDVLPAAAPEPSDEELRVAVPALPATWDPALASTLAEAQVLPHVLEPLIRPAGDGRSFVPGIAESWSYDRSELTFSVTLDRAARFSTGSPVTAVDVAFSVDDWRAGPRHGSDFAVIDDVTVVDDSHLVFHLARPTADLEHLLSRPAAAVYPLNYGDHTRADFLAEPYGAGPYRISEWRPAAEVVLVSNPVHHRAVDTAFDRIVVTAIADADDRSAAFHRGTIDITEIASRHIVETPGRSIVHAAPHRLSFVGVRRGSRSSGAEAIRSLTATIDHPGLADLGHGTLAIPYGVAPGDGPGPTRASLAVFDGAELLFDARNDDHRLLAGALAASLRPWGPELHLLGLDRRDLDRRLASGAYELMIVTTGPLETAADLPEALELIPLVAHRVAFARDSTIGGFAPAPMGTWWFPDLTREDAAADG